MSLIPWTRPSLSERISGLAPFDDLLTNMFRGFPRLAPSEDVGWMPAVDVKDNDSHITVTAELPGVNKEDIKIDVNHNHLTLRGEKKEEKTEKQDNWWRREVSYGSFMRQIALPADVDANNTEAKMTNGVLTIRLPKVSGAKTKPIKVG